MLAATFPVLRVGKIRLSQSGTQLRPKEQCQWLDRDQKCRIARSAQRPIWRERNRRRQIVDMRVKAQIPCPGLQHAKHANLPAKEARILGKLLERCGGGPKEQGVERAGLAPRDCPESSRQSEGDQEVWYGQQQRLLLR